MEKKYLDQLKKAIEEKKVILGAKRTIKYLKTKDLKLIIVSSNCPENVRKDLESYNKIANIEIIEFDGTGKGLGIICGKPFQVATLGIK